MRGNALKERRIAIDIACRRKLWVSAFFFDYLKILLLTIFINVLKSGLPVTVERGTP